MKGKMAKEGIQLVSVTHEFKFRVPDGKQRAADAFDDTGVRSLAKHYPNSHRQKNNYETFEMAGV